MVEGKNTTSPSPGGEASSWEEVAYGRAIQERVSVVLFLPPPETPSVLASGWAPATSKTQAPVGQFACPTGGDSVTDVLTGDAGKSPISELLFPTYKMKFGS